MPECRICGKHINASRCPSGLCIDCVRRNNGYKFGNSGKKGKS